MKGDTSTGRSPSISVTPAVVPTATYTGNARNRIASPGVIDRSTVLLSG
ncbi:MAG: hypothetical protein Q8L86_05275 [Vicinamibacterales bacterium]|nr:hypothetical protein [Vicinamibacterales bacterium]